MQVTAAASAFGLQTRYGAFLYSQLFTLDEGQNYAGSTGVFQVFAVVQGDAVTDDNGSIENTRNYYVVGLDLSSPNVAAVGFVQASLGSELAPVLGAEYSPTRVSQRRGEQRCLVTEWMTSVLKEYGLAGVVIVGLVAAVVTLYRRNRHLEDHRARMLEKLLEAAGARQQQQSKSVRPYRSNSPPPGRYSISTTKSRTRE